MTDDHARRPAPDLFTGMEAAHVGDHATIAFHGRYTFDASPEEAWSIVGSVAMLGQMLGWLRQVESTAPVLATGVRMDGVVQPPIPWTMRVGIDVDEAVPAERVDATISGDLRGPARLDIRPAGTGSEIAIAWHMSMGQRAMRAAARVSLPLLVWGHDQVVAATVGSLRDHLDE